MNNCKHILHTTYPHCSYLNIYISQKIRLCVVDLEGQFQTTLQAKDINFLIWKFRSIILIFLLFFAGVVKSSAFCTLCLQFWVENSKFQFWSCFLQWEIATLKIAEFKWQENEIKMSWLCCTEYTAPRLGHCFFMLAEKVFQ